MARIRLEGITKRFGGVVALDDVSLDIADGEFFIVLGPPGAGKTTLLRTIAGLEHPDAGDVFLDGDRMTDVYPGDRDLAIMFQNLALYSDKTVEDNLAFPLRQRKLSKVEIQQRVAETARVLHIESLVKRKPGTLSGGERQRVALGRVLVRDPRALLLDEPLSALDALLRLEMRAELKRMQLAMGRTFVYVTHDQVEAMTMADRVAVLRNGVVQQVDRPENIYSLPTNRFVATTVGSPAMNLIPATLVSAHGRASLVHPEFTLEVARGVDLDTGTACLIGVRPEDVHLRARGEGIAAAVYATEPLGPETIVDLSLGGHIVKALVAPDVELNVDATVGVELDLARLHVFAPDGRNILSALGEDRLFRFQPTTTSTSPSARGVLAGGL